MLVREPSGWHFKNTRPDIEYPTYPLKASLSETLSSGMNVQGDVAINKEAGKGVSCHLSLGWPVNQQVVDVTSRNAQERSELLKSVNDALAQRHESNARTPNVEINGIVDRLHEAATLYTQAKYGPARTPEVLDQEYTNWRQEVQAEQTARKAKHADNGEGVLIRAKPVLQEADQEVEEPVHAPRPMRM